MKKNLIKLIATFFYMGYMPFAPGTWGSLGGAIVYFMVRHDLHLAIGSSAALFLLGLYAAGKAEDIFGKKDDLRIVIDEACALLLLFLMIPPGRNYLIAGFLLFRLFDALKPYPARKLEKLPRSWGIMADDFVAVFYSYAIISIAMWLFTLKAR